MKLLCVAMLCCWGGLAQAELTVVQSPNTAQTYSYHSITWKQLRWVPGEKALVAAITFSNEDFESQEEPKREERFDFTFPGVTFDEAQGVFYVRGEGNERIPVASVQRGLFGLLGKEIKLMPNAKVEISSNSGKIQVALTASVQERSGARWVER